ncbi:MAG: hypothetical protein JJ897_11005 [Marinibacterium sp.]|nr:hypothetical protein [Marinibacterium sp.]
MVNFFIYLMCWVPRPGQLSPMFKDIMAAYFADGITRNPSLLLLRWGS